MEVEIVRDVVSLQIPNLLDERDAIVISEDEDRLHVGYLLNDGKVIFFERIKGMYPDLNLIVCNNLKEYAKKIYDVDWTLTSSPS